MSSFINTNIESLNAQRNLSTSQSALATSLQRLSSGLRINSAKDDAAGLAISSRMTSQINGNNQAARNANDGISLAQTAEGDLAQIGANLQRMRDLSVQSSNATNSASDRAALQNEVDQLRQEIDRVAQASSFNGVKLLDGTFTSQTFQVGANNVSAQDRITIASIASARTSALGGSYSATVTSSAVNTAAISSGNVTMNGVSVIDSVSDGVSTVNATASARAKATAINGTGGTGVTATAVTNVAGASQTLTAGTGTFTINGVTTGTITQLGGTVGVDQAATVTAINAISGATGVIATATNVVGTGITLQAADGRNIAISLTQATGTFSSATTGVATAASPYAGTLTLSTSGNTGITAGGTVAIIGSPTTTAATATGSALSVIDISSVSGAQTALASIDAAIATLNTSRASLGAYQNRFESVVTSLNTTSENLTASRSRIMDTDFAAETAHLTRAQILQQAGTAMLAQANQLPNTVLTLLR